MPGVPHGLRRHTTPYLERDTVLLTVHCSSWVWACQLMGSIS